MDREKLADLVTRFTEAFNREDGKLRFHTEDLFVDAAAGKALIRWLCTLETKKGPAGWRGLDKADLREGEGASAGRAIMSTTPPIQRVAVALFEGFTVLDVYGPVQAFASCRVLQPDGKRRPFFEIFSMAAEAGRVKAGEGPASWAEWSFEKAPDYDILLIPGGFGTRAAVADQAFVERVAAASRRARVTTTVCTGSAILARTGLLDGRPATSNKIAWDWVTQQGPKVLWRRKARWVDDGNMVTSSGVSAGIDMALALIARLHGREMALTSARNMEYVWREDAEDDPFA